VDPKDLLTKAQVTKAVAVVTKVLLRDRHQLAPVVAGAQPQPLLVVVDQGNSNES
jgi:hypothetical protein